MEAKHKVGETIRVNRAFCGVDSFTVGCIVTQKEVLDYNEMENSEEFPAELNDHFIYSEESGVEHVFNFNSHWVYEEDILDEDEVSINNYIDPCCNVWHNNKCIGQIRNATALHDFMVQLKRRHLEGKDISGYSIGFDDEEIPVTLNGDMPRLEFCPGLYDHTDKCLEELLGF